MTNRCLLPALLSLALCSILNLSAAQPAVTPEAILEKIAKAEPHPRLLWTAKEDAAIRDKISADPRLKSAWEAVRITADHMLKEPPVVYRKEGRRLLGRSREALSRMTHLGFAWRITGEQKYFDRAVAEMQAMAAMSDWNPSHFLDTAEMTLALAIGYDWFYGKLTPEVRAKVRQAIEEKGLAPYLNAKNRLGWEHGGNNWNQVCHAGMLAGALALSEENPKRAAEVISRGLAGLPYAMKVYDPDGNYPEGPGYWNYGTTFNVIFIAMLESAVGTDFGVSQSPGFLKAADFPLHTMGPTLQAFNFGDCGRGASFSPAVPWFAARTDRPDLMWYQWTLLEEETASTLRTRGRSQVDRTFPLSIIWAKKGWPRQAPTQTAWLARGQNPLAIFRSSWTDPNAVFVAMKAGTPSASHAHLDIGSFIMDAGGVRWSMDLGSQEYNELEQRGFDLWNNRQDSQRWTLFRYHNRGHSTLLVNDDNQLIASKAPIEDFSPEKRSALMDLTQTYSAHLAKATRRISMVPETRTVVVEDSLVAKDKEATVRWGMVTPATLKPDGANKAILELQGKRLKMEVTAPGTIQIKSWPADRPPGAFDQPNPGASVVGYEVKLTPGQAATLKTTFQCP